MDSLNIVIPSQSVKYDSIIDVCQLVQELHDMGFKNVSEEKKRTEWCKWSTAEWRTTQRGRVVSVPDLKSVGPGFKSRSDY